MSVVQDYMTLKLWGKHILLISPILLYIFNGKLTCVDIYVHARDITFKISIIHFYTH